MRLAVRATPRGGRDAIDGWMADEAGRPVLKVRVAAAATEGAANAAVLALLANSLGLPKSRLSLARGDTSRLKQIEVEGLAPEDLARAFGSPPA